MFQIQPIIKPVSIACNLACSYCYYGPPRKYEARQNKKPSIMSLNTLKTLITAFSEYDDIPDFIWHGGEPLLAGLAFYKQVVKLQQKILGNRSFTNIIQTNGTLITPEWTKFFKQHNFSVGISLDGTQDAHDLYRKSHNGQGSSSAVLRGISYLQDAGIQVSVICTVTKANIRQPKEVYKFLRALNLCKIKFSHLHERERFGEHSSVAVTPEEYANFLIAIFHEWINEDNDEVEIHDLKSIIQSLTGGQDKDCIFLGLCDHYVTIESDGSVSWCDTISRMCDMPNFGNIQNGIKSIVESENFISFQRKIQNLRENKQKEDYFSLISFGCIGDYRELPLDSHSENTFATAWMKLAKTIADELQKYDFQLAVNV